MRNITRYAFPALLLAAHIGIWHEWFLPRIDGPAALLALLWPIYPVMCWPERVRQP